MNLTITNMVSEIFEITKMYLGQSNRIIGPSRYDEFPNEMKIM